MTRKIGKPSNEELIIKISKCNELLMLFTNVGIMNDVSI